jgi:hypothetical protein
MRVADVWCEQPRTRIEHMTFAGTLVLAVKAVV